MEEVREELELDCRADDSPGSGLPMTTSGNDPMQVEPAAREPIFRDPGGEAGP